METERSERTFLTMDEGVQRFPFQKNKVMDIVGLFFFFFNEGIFSPGNLIPEEVKIKLCLQVCDYSTGRGIRWAGWTSPFAFFLGWRAGLAPV